MSLITGIYRSFTKTHLAPGKSGLEEELRTRLIVSRMYARSYSWVRQQPNLFSEVHNYAMFLGHARSGGSLAGALLDAHFNTIIADEVDVFQYVDAGFTRDQIFHILLERSQRQAKKGRVKAGRDGKMYSYQVPGAWQGCYERLSVIGHSKAGISTRRIGKDPGVLERLQKLLGNIQLKLILILRNPYDTISTKKIRTGVELESGMTEYFANCAAMHEIQDLIPSENLLVMRHEDLLRIPGTHLRQMCALLEIPATEEYLEACSSILYASPAASRTKVKWSPEMIHKVELQIEHYPFLQGYSYES
jgi:sulfotransferase family protein